MSCTLHKVEVDVELRNEVRQLSMVEFLLSYRDRPPSTAPQHHNTLHMYPTVP